MHAKDTRPYTLSPGRGPFLTAGIFTGSLTSGLVVCGLSRFDDRWWSVHPRTQPFNSSRPGSCPNVFSLHPNLTPPFPNTSTHSQSYEQLRSRVTARLDGPTSPGRNQSPARLEDEMGMGSSLDQGPSSSGGDQNDTSHNDAVKAMAELNHVITTYNVTPSVASNAQFFMRVRKFCLSPSRLLTLE